MKPKFENNKETCPNTVGRAGKAHIPSYNKGEGCHFWDAAGKKYLDLSAQNACLNAEYNNKTIMIR